MANSASAGTTNLRPNTDDTVRRTVPRISSRFSLVSFTSKASIDPTAKRACFAKRSPSAVILICRVLL